MPRFRYRAIDAQNQAEDGEIDAASEADLAARLRADGRYLIEVAPTGSRVRETRSRPSSGRRVGKDAVGVLAVELATLLESGVQLDDALQLLERLDRAGPMHELVARLHRAVRRGESLSTALREEGDPFPAVYVNMVHAGEESDALGPALARVSEMVDRQREFREAMAGALTYPAILLAVAGISLTIILGYVVPRFAEMFADAGVALPLATRIVVAIGGLVDRYWWVLVIAVIGAGLALHHYARDPAARARRDEWLLRLPVLGRQLATVEAARFARILGTLLAAGLLEDASLPMARSSVVNESIRARLGEVEQRYRAGARLSDALAEAAVFPELATHLVRVGEESELAPMLLRIADIYEREVQTRLRRFLAILGPVVILVLGMLVAGVIMSIVVAILGINELAR